MFAEHQLVLPIMGTQFEQNIVNFPSRYLFSREKSYMIPQVHMEGGRKGGGEGGKARQRSKIKF